MQNPFKKTHRSRRVFALLSATVFGLAALFGLAQAQAQSGQTCFPETNQCISGRIQEFWLQNGGLPVFGYPITPQAPENTAEGTFQAQWFERARLELHPENAPPYDVLLGRLGVDRLEQQGRDWFSFPKASDATRARSDCIYFAQTGHSVCGRFLTAYRSYGLSFANTPGITFDESLALFGQPISEPQQEMSSLGTVLWTQWFERARFEYHPENAAPYDVLFGRLGAEVLAEAQPPIPTATAAPPTATPGPGPNGCTLAMSWVRDIAVPNGSILQPGAQFNRIWRVRNDGTCYWHNYRLVFANGDQLGAPASVAVPSTSPHAQVDITVPMVAPMTPGSYRGFWVMQATNGATFDGLVVDIVVAAEATPTATLALPTATIEAPTATVEAPTATVEAPTATVEAPTATPTVGVAVPIATP